MDGHKKTTYTISNLNPVFTIEGKKGGQEETRGGRNENSKSGDDGGISRVKRSDVQNEFHASKQDEIADPLSLLHTLETTLKQYHTTSLTAVKSLITLTGRIQDLSRQERDGTRKVLPELWAVMEDVNRLVLEVRRSVEELVMLRALGEEERKDGGGIVGGGVVDLGRGEGRDGRNVGKGGGNDNSVKEKIVGVKKKIERFGLGGGNHHHHHHSS